MPLDGMNFEPRVERDETLALLRRARERVAQGWMQGQVYFDGRYCSVGALSGKANKYRPHEEAVAALFWALPWWARFGWSDSKQVAVIAYNDRRGRTQAQIVALFDRAIAHRAGGRA